MNFSELENVECFRCGAPRWIHGRSDWFCEEFVDPNSVEAVYDEWGVEIKPSGKFNGRVLAGSSKPEVHNG